VTTDLFLAAAGLDALALIRAVPPACLRGVDPAPITARDGSDTLLMLPTWTPRRPAVHLLPSFAPLTDGPLAFRFEVSALADGEWSSWAASATIGAADFPAPTSPTTPLTCDVDVFRAAPAVDDANVGSTGGRRLDERRDEGPEAAEPEVARFGACSRAQ